MRYRTYVARTVDIVVGLNADLYVKREVAVGAQCEIVTGGDLDAARTPFVLVRD